MQSVIQHSKLCFVEGSGDEANKSGSGSSSDSDSNSSSSDGEIQCLFWFPDTTMNNLLCVSLVKFGAPHTQGWLFHSYIAMGLL